LTKGRFVESEYQHAEIRFNEFAINASNGLGTSPVHAGTQVGMKTTMISNEEVN